jgi:hypothetical protein
MNYGSLRKVAARNGASKMGKFWMASRFFSSVTRASAETQVPVFLITTGPAKLTKGIIARLSALQSVGLEIALNLRGLHCLRITLGHALHYTLLFLSRAKSRRDGAGVDSLHARIQLAGKSRRLK